MIVKCAQEMNTDVLVFYDHKEVANSWVFSSKGIIGALQSQQLKEWNEAIEGDTVQTDIWQADFT